MKILKSKVILFLILELLIACLFVKAISLNTKFIDHDSTFYFRVFQSIANDSIIYFFILLFTYLSYLSFVNKYISIFFRLISFIIFFFYVIDIIILFKFANHLVLNDLTKFALYLPKYIEQHYSFNLLYFIGISFILFLSIYFIFFTIKIKRKSTHYYFNLIFLVLLITYLNIDTKGFIHSWLYKNFVTYNLDIYDQSRPYSNTFIDKLEYNEKFTCVNLTSTTPNIIILMVESLSSYQSNYFSGIKNWTPNIDKIAKENINLINFHSNGFVTEDAEIAIITGELPIYSPNSFSKGGGVFFNGFYNISHSLPNILKKYNYHSEFITSSNLNFSNTGKWAKSNGFEYIEGSEHSYYKNKTRYHFDAAEDKYLYHRVINRLDEQKSNFLLFVKTVSSHAAPFKNPENNSSSEEETIKYMDKQIGIFYKKLKKTNFFKKGMLIIVGDHHPIIPIKEEAIKKYGQFQSSSITPAIVVYKNKKQTISQYFQQTDIYNSLKNLISSKECVSPWKGDFLSSKPLKPKYIVHRRGDQRGVVSIFSENGDFNIKLNGDNTHIIEDYTNKDVVSKINYSRIQRDNLKYKFQENTN